MTKEIIPHARNYVAKNYSLRLKSLKLAEQVLQQAEDSGYCLEILGNHCGVDDSEWAQLEFMLQQRGWRVTWVCAAGQRTDLLLTPACVTSFAVRVGKTFSRSSVDRAYYVAMALIAQGIACQPTGNVIECQVADGCPAVATTAPRTEFVPVDLDNPFPEAADYEPGQMAKRRWVAKLNAAIERDIGMCGYAMACVDWANLSSLEAETQAVAVEYACGIFEKLLWRVTRVYREKAGQEQLRLLVLTPAADSHISIGLHWKYPFWLDRRD